MVSYKSSAVKIFCSYIRRYGFHLSDHTVEICQRKFWSTHWLDSVCIDLTRDTISYYVIHFRMARAHECPLAAVCTTVSRETWKAVALASFDFLRPQTWWDCRKKLPNDRNGRRQLIVLLVDVSSLLLLPNVATAGKSIWMVYLLGSELESLLRHGSPYCTLRPLPSFTAIRL